MELKKRYLFLSIFFLFLEVLVIIKNTSVNGYQLFFWFCDFVPILLFLALLLKDEQFVKGIISIGFIPQMLSLISLFFAVFLKINILGLGFTDIFNYNWFYITSSFILHTFSINLALLFTYKTKPKIQSLIYSFLILIIVLFLTLLFTLPSENINYVFNSDFLRTTFPYYTYFYVFYAFILVVLPTYFIQYLLYKHRTKSKK